MRHGIYGNKIANYFNPPLPNPKTNNELIELRRRMGNWERRREILMSSKRTNSPPTSGLGKKLKDLQSGKHHIQLDLNQLSGRTLGAGVYFIQLETIKEQAIKKSIILKN